MHLNLAYKIQLLMLQNFKLSYSSDYLFCLLLNLLICSWIHLACGLFKICLIASAKNESKIDDC
jgi:hypothetical protein